MTLTTELLNMITIIGQISITAQMNMAMIYISIPYYSKRCLSHCVACPPVAFPSLLPSTRKSSSKLCYLIWAFCAMYAASRDLVGRLCKHSVTGSTHVYLLKHQSHTEAVKETRRRLTAQHTQWERTCGITFKCNQSTEKQTMKWKGWVYFSWMRHIWKATNEDLFKG